MKHVHVVVLVYPIIQLATGTTDLCPSSHVISTFCIKCLYMALYKVELPIDMLFNMLAGSSYRTAQVSWSQSGTKLRATCAWALSSSTMLRLGSLS